MVISIDCFLLQKGSSLLINANNGAYTSGCVCPLEKKLFVVSVCDWVCHKSGGMGPVLANVVRDVSVLIRFASKVVDEIHANGTFLPDNLKQKHRGPQGMGIKVVVTGRPMNAVRTP